MLGLPLAHKDYTIGWICALPKEQTAATAVLDEIHPDLPKPVSDNNAYTLGCINSHNIVIVCLPKGQIGNNSASNVATQMVNTFPSIKVGLMVGIGGGVPPKVRLGDVVVSTPVDQFPSVVQWDLGKIEQDGIFKRTGALNNPPSTLLTALTRLETKHDLRGSKIRQYLDEMGEKWPNLTSKYTQSEHLRDPLSPDAKSGRSQIGDIPVHYGLIASGNQVIKDAEFRDKLDASLGGNVLCFEMEAAGLMNHFPCIIIRGICDYADSEKNKDWQGYAAAVAAAYAKELLEYVRPGDMDQERPVKEILNEVLNAMSSIGENITQMKRKLDKDKDLAICNWLTEPNYDAQHTDNIRRRQEGTGQWLLESVEYQGWLGVGRKTLFCPGIPGAGKTILTAIVVDNLHKRFCDNDTVGIAYIYCNYRRQEGQTSDHLLLSLLRQLVQQRPSLPKSVKALYHGHRRRKSRPSRHEIVKTLCAVCTMFSRTFVAVDALDECQSAERSRFLSEMSDIQVKCGLSFFATSRFIGNITARFEDSAILEIRASQEDIQRYLDNNMSRLPACVRRARDVQEKIKSTVIGAVDGMFLLARLYLDSLDDKITVKEVEMALIQLQRQHQRLKKGQNNRAQLLSQAYDQAMDRIISQKDDLKKLAMNVLSWLVHSKRSLTIPELQHALAVEMNTTDLDLNNIPEVVDIVSVCAGLVALDEESHIVRLVHYTTQDYFEATQKMWFPGAEDMIATVCVTYLSFSTFENEFRGERALEDLSSSHYFYSYAAQHWAHHTSRSAIEGTPLVMDFLQSSGKLSTCTWFSMAPSCETSRATQLTGVHLTAYHGLCKSLTELLKQGHSPDTKNYQGWTPLSCASRNGHEAVVRLLLNTPGVDPMSEDSTLRMTPLAQAASRGHDKVIKLLLNQHGIHPDSRDKNGTTPLSWAAKRKHEGAVRMLLEAHGVDPDSKSRDGLTPLLEAARAGHAGIVKILLDRPGVDPNFKDKYGSSPLSWAAASGHLAVVELLVDFPGVDLHTMDNRNRSPLWWAVKEGHEEVVKILREKGLMLGYRQSKLA